MPLLGRSENYGSTSVFDNRPIDSDSTIERNLVDRTIYVIFHVLSNTQLEKVLNTEELIMLRPSCVRSINLLLKIVFIMLAYL